MIKKAAIVLGIAYLFYADHMSRKVANETNQVLTLHNDVLYEHQEAIEDHGDRLERNGIA